MRFVWLGIPYRTKFRWIKLPKICLAAENFCPPKVLSAEICSVKSKTSQIDTNFMLRHIFLVNCNGEIRQTNEKISSDKTAKISTWCRKFLSAKFCPIMYSTLAKFYKFRPPVPPEWKDFCEFHGECSPWSNKLILSMNPIFIYSRKIKEQSQKSVNFKFFWKTPRRTFGIREG